MGCGQKHGLWPCNHNDDCDCFHCKPDKRRPLQKGTNIDGRPVWEPPIFDYSRWMGDEYDKTRAAVMKYTNNDVVKTTNILDVDVEKDLLEEYRTWVLDQSSYLRLSSAKCGDHPEYGFMLGLKGELSRDFSDVDLEFEEFRIYWRRTEDDRLWEVLPWPPTEYPSPIDGEMKELPTNISEEGINNNNELNQCTSTAEHISQAEDESNNMITKLDPDVPSSHATSISSPPTFNTTPFTKETQLSERVPTSHISTAHGPKTDTEISKQTSAFTTEPNDILAPAESQPHVSISSTPPSDLVTQWWQAATTVIRHMN